MPWATGKRGAQFLKRRVISEARALSGVDAWGRHMQEAKLFGVRICLLRSLALTNGHKKGLFDKRPLKYC